MDKKTAIITGIAIVLVILLVRQANAPASELAENKSSETEQTETQSEKASQFTDKEILSALPESRENCSEDGQILRDGGTCCNNERNFFEVSGGAYVCGVEGETETALAQAYVEEYGACNEELNCIGHAVCRDGKCEPGPAEPIGPPDGKLILEADPLGNNAVQLRWGAPEGLDESNRFIIVRDHEENPEHTGNNFWIRQSHLKREVIWQNIPEGAWHFRICLTENNEKNTCSSYSNNVEVNVE